MVRARPLGQFVMLKRRPVKLPPFSEAAMYCWAGRGQSVGGWLCRDLFVHCCGRGSVGKERYFA